MTLKGSTTLFGSMEQGILLKMQLAKVVMLPVCNCLEEHWFFTSLLVWEHEPDRPG